MIRAWQPKSVQQELAIVQRYYSKSYDTDTAPGIVTSNGIFRAVAASTGGTNNQITYCFKQTMRTGSPNVIVWNYATGAANSARNISSATDVTPGAPVDTNSQSVTVYSVTSVNQGQYVGYQITAEAEL